MIMVIKMMVWIMTIMIIIKGVTPTTMIVIITSIVLINN